MAVSISIVELLRPPSIYRCENVPLQTAKKHSIVGMLQSRVIDRASRNCLNERTHAPATLCLLHQGLTNNDGFTTKSRLIKLAARL
jgi:hypothetical protein